MNQMVEGRRIPGIESTRFLQPAIEQMGSEGAQGDSEKNDGGRNSNGSRLFQFSGNVSLQQALKKQRPTFSGPASAERIAILCGCFVLLGSPVGVFQRQYLSEGQNPVTIFCFELNTEWRI